MRAVLLMGLVLLSGPVLATPPAPPSAWLERQQAAGADEANAAGGDGFEGAGGQGALPGHEGMEGWRDGGAAQGL
nr:hypothetical protein [Stenotrophomonas geniculata]